MQKTKVAEKESAQREEEGSTYTTQATGKLFMFYINLPD